MPRSRLCLATSSILVIVILSAIVAPTTAAGALLTLVGGPRSGPAEPPQTVSAPPLLVPSLTGSGGISGVVFFDANGDGLRDLDEAGMADVTVEARDETTGGGTYYASTTTASDGTYQFAGLDAGNYIVIEADAPGYVSTTSNSQTISVGTAVVTGVDFGDTLTFTVTGVVFNDLDGDGAQKPTEPGTPDVPVELYADVNMNGLVDTGEALLGDTVTDASGNYAIHGIRPGYRVLCIWPPGGSSSPGGNQVGLTLISADGMGTNAFYQNFPLLPDTEPLPACAFDTSIVSRFNNTSIPVGRTVWFTSRLAASGLGADETTIYFENVWVQFPANNTTYRLALPRAKVVFSPSAATTTTFYDAASQTWVTTVSSGNMNKQVFLSGLAFPAPAAGLPGNIRPVTMSGRFSSSKAGVTLQWEWAAAVYTSFSGDYNALGVKPVSASTENPYNNQDTAGTPENFKAFVTDGARGRGGTNYTGSDTSAVRGLCVSPAVPPYQQRVNCGSVSYTDTWGQVWSADRRYSLGGWGYLDGGAKSSASPVAGTEDDFLYQKYREKPVEYRFTVPDDDYDVTLKFTEFAAHSADERVMRITIEGAVAEPALSILAQVGKYQALDRTYVVSVSDGLLTIVFEKAAGASKEPVVSAIEITTHGATITPTPTPTPTSTPEPTPTPTPLPYVQAVNSGSATYTDAQGTVWAGDKKFKTGSWGYTAGSAKSSAVPIEGTTEDILYQSYRENPHEYRFTVPNGTYEVTLAFAELVATRDTDRIMRITIEGTVVEPALNLFTEVGRYKALDRVYTVAVTDGVLNIAFAKTGGSAKEPIVNAVKVRSR